MYPKIELRSENIQLIADFLALKKIAVAGISESVRPGNSVFKRFVDAGYEVTGIHPVLKEFEGKPCYSSVLKMPFVPEGVFVLTSPEVTERITDDCIKAGVKYIWMHNMTGFKGSSDRMLSSTTSISRNAVLKAREAGIRVIAGSCPMQHIPPVDIFHRCIRWIFRKEESKA